MEIEYSGDSMEYGVIITDRKVKMDKLVYKMASELRVTIIIDSKNLIRDICSFLGMP